MLANKFFIFGNLSYAAVRVGLRSPFIFFRHLVHGVFAFLLLGSLSPSLAATLTLQWDPSPGSVTGYRLHFTTGAKGTPYTTAIPLSKITKVTVSGLIPGKTYRFALTAYLGTMESGYSNEVVWTAPASTEVLPATARTAVAMGPSSANTSEVRVLNSSMSVLKSFVAFDQNSVRFGARVAMGDIDGDGTDEVIVAKGEGIGNNSEIKVYRQDGTPVSGANVIAFSSRFRYGARVATGDFDGDGRAEIAVGTSEGPALVRIFDYDPLKTQLSDTGVRLTAFSAGTNGVNIAASDVSGDGIPELITTPASKTARPAVKAWQIDASKGVGKWTASASTFSPQYVLQNSTGGGAAVGNGGGDLFAIGSGTSGGKFEVYSRSNTYDCLSSGVLDNTLRQRYGIELSVGDVDADGSKEIVVSLGENPASDSRLMVYGSNCSFKKTVSPVFPGSFYGTRTAVGKISGYTFTP